MAVHMYVLQYMHEYTVNIDGTLISNFMYLLLVLLNLTFLPVIGVFSSEYILWAKTCLTKQ